LAKTTNGQDYRLWLITGILFTVTVATGSELAYLFVAAGLITSILYTAPWRRKATPGTTSAAAIFLPLAHARVLALAAVSAGTLATLLLFFLKASAFTFGSGLAIVPFLHQGVVVDHGWLTEREFLDAVALGIITPGPVVIMAAFVGYLVAGVAGALLAAFGVFAPVWIINVIVGRIFLRYRTNPQVRGFVKGATAAAVGAIAGACVILGSRAIIDAPTVAIFLLALPVLYFRRLSEPAVIGIAGIAGLALF
jgi:chromate transporter